MTDLRYGHGRIEAAPAATDYDDIAERYAAGIDERPWNALYERPAMLALLPDVSGLDVLDAGCGPGWYVLELARRGARVVGIDASARMVELARRRVGARARIAQARLGAVGDALPDASFDLVLSSLVIHYIEALVPVFAEWARLLRPGGIALLSTHHPFSDAPPADGGGYLATELVEEEWGWLGATMRFYRRPLSAVTEPLSQAGFVIERIVEARAAETMRLADPRSYEQLARRPGFLHIRARKDAGAGR